MCMRLCVPFMVYYFAICISYFNTFNLNIFKSNNPSIARFYIWKKEKDVTFLISNWNDLKCVLGRLCFGSRKLKWVNFWQGLLDMQLIVNGRYNQYCAQVIGNGVYFGLNCYKSNSSKCQFNCGKRNQIVNPFFFLSLTHSHVSTNVSFFTLDIPLAFYKLTQPGTLRLQRKREEKIEFTKIVPNKRITRATDEE